MKKDGLIFTLPELLENTTPFENPTEEELQDGMKSLGIIEDIQARKLFTLHVNLQKESKRAKKVGATELAAMKKSDSIACYALFINRFHEVMKPHEKTDKTVAILLENWEAATIDISKTNGPIAEIIIMSRKKPVFNQSTSNETPLH